MLEDWLPGHVPNADIRLTGVELGRAFGGVTAINVSNLLTALESGHGHGSHVVLQWMPMLNQLHLSGRSGTDIYNVMHGMTSGGGALTGSQLLAFWNTVLGGTGRSEVLLDCIAQVNGGGTATVIRDCLVAFMTIGSPIRLTKERLLIVLRKLRQRLTNAQTILFCNYLQRHLVGLGVLDTDKKFERRCQDIYGYAVDQATFNNFINVHPGLTDAQMAELLIELPFRFLYELLTAALPATATVPGVHVPAPPDLVAYAITRGNIDDAILFLDKARELNVSHDCIFKLISHLQRVGAGDRVKRITKFIEDVNPERNRGRAEQSWDAIGTLLDRFVADNRHTHAPGAVPAAAAVDVGQCHCPGSRIQSFMTGHTFGYLDFGNVGRTADNITFFDPGTDVAGMRTAVDTAFNALPAVTIETAAEAEAMTITQSAGYELGLVADQYNEGDVALMHFMPHSTNADHYWHKRILAPFRPLFP